jgi:hypothetical protein
MRGGVPVFKRSTRKGSSRNFFADFQLVGLQLAQRHGFPDQYALYRQEMCLQ